MHLKIFYFYRRLNSKKFREIFETQNGGNKKQICTGS